MLRLGAGNGRTGALSVPNYRTYFVGSAVSLSGAWLLRTAQAWLVLDLTGSSAALGVIVIAQYMPVMFLSLFAGVVMDRVRTRELMIIVQGIIGVQAAVLAVLVVTGQVQYWQVVLLAMIQGFATAFDLPTRSSIVSELVGPAQVGNGIAVNSSLNSAARIVGPGIGGLMIALWGNGVCFAVTAITYLCAVTTLLFLKADQFYPKRQADQGAVLGQLWDGLKYSFSTPSLGFNMVLSLFIGTWAYNWGLVLPLFARYALDSGPEAFGSLNVAMGIGSMAAALLLATRISPSLRLVTLSAAGYAFLTLFVSLAPTLPIALALLVLTGVGNVAFSATSNTLLQVEAQPEFRGRVLSLYMFLLSGTSPLGGGFTGLVADHWNIRTALGLNGAICVFGVVVALVFLKMARARRLSLGKLEQAAGA